MSALVTGDAVVLELPPAGVATRFLGLLLDAVIYNSGLIAVTLALAAITEGADIALATAVTLAGVVGVLIVVPIVVETLSRGRSVGKLVTGTRVVRDDGGPIRTRHAVTRQLVGFAEFYVLFGLVTIFVVLANSRTKRLGDLLAGTYVISERTPLLASPMSGMPPELASWARSADVGRIPGQLALAARTYLARARTMTPESAAQLGADLARELTPLVSPPPPAGTSAERFVAAVLAERRRRDGERLAAEREQVRRLRELVDRRRERV